MPTPHATDPAAESPPSSEELPMPEPREPEERRRREPEEWAAAVERIAQKARAAGLTRPDAAAERLREQAAARARQSELRTNLLHALAQVPPLFAEAEPTHPEVARWCEEVAARRTRDSLVLLGPVETGKTHQAFGAYRWLARRGVGRCHAVTVPALLDGLRPGRPGAVDYEAVERCDLLLLDDLAAERVTDWTGETLYRLIDARYAWQRPTIITTNATPADVRERLGDRVASRLGRMGRTVSLTASVRQHRPGA